MANGTQVNITVNANQAVRSIYRLKRDWKVVKADLQGPVSIDILKGSKFDKQTKYTKTMDPDSFWGQANNFGKTVRSWHIYGINPLTRGIAKMGSTILGSFIHPVTLATTAIMLLGVGLKKLHNILRDNEQAIKARGQTITSFATKNIENVQKQKKAFEQLAKQFDELYKNDVLSQTQQDINKTLIAQLAELFPDLKVEIDQTTGKLKNFAQLQADVLKKQKDIELDSIKLMQDANNRTLDAILNNTWNTHDVLNKWRIFSKRGGAGPTGATGPMANDFFVEFGYKWIDDFLDGLGVLRENNIPKRLLDTNLLYSGDYAKQLKFFQQYAQLPGSDKFTSQVNEIIQLLTKQVELQKQKETVSSPLALMLSNTKEVDKQLQGILKKEVELSKNRISSEEAYQKQLDRIQYQDLSLEEKQQQKQKEQLQFETKIAELQKRRAQNVDKIGDLQVTRGSTGQLTTTTLDDLLTNNEELRKYNADLKKLEEQRERTIANEKNRLLTQIQNMELAYPWLPTGRQGMNPNEDRAKDEYERLWEQYGNINPNAYADYQKKATALRNKLFDSQGEALSLYQDEIRKIIETNRILDQQKEIDSQITDSKSQLASIIGEISSLNKEEKNRLQREDEFYNGIVSPHLRQLFKDTEMAKALRYQELSNQLLAIRGPGASLSDEDKERLMRAAQLQTLNNYDDFNEYRNRYSVRTNELAERGGFASSVLISGLQNIDKEQLKTSKQQEKVLNLIRDVDVKILNAVENIGVIQ